MTLFLPLRILSCPSFCPVLSCPIVFYNFLFCLFASSVLSYAYNLSLSFFLSSLALTSLPLFHFNDFLPSSLLLYGVIKDNMETDVFAFVFCSVNSFFNVFFLFVTLLTVTILNNIIVKHLKFCFEKSSVNKSLLTYLLEGALSELTFQV